MFRSRYWGICNKDKCIKSIGTLPKQPFGLYIWYRYLYVSLQNSANKLADSRIVTMLSGRYLCISRRVVVASAIIHRSEVINKWQHKCSSSGRLNTTRAHKETGMLMQEAYYPLSVHNITGLKLNCQILWTDWKLVCWRIARARQ